MSKNKSRAVGISAGGYISTEKIHFRSLNSQPLSEGEEFLVIKDTNLTDQYRMLEGRILTILESAITNEKQLEAIKSLVRSEIWNNHGDIYCAFLNGKQLLDIK
jgi:hypothetical protein